MASCVKAWPTAGQPDLIFFGKTSNCGNNIGYVDVFKPKILILRTKKASFTSLSARNNKRDVSIRFYCKACKNDFVFKALKKKCFPGTDVKWKRVPPTDKSCKCFLECTTIESDDDEDTEGKEVENNLQNEIPKASTPRQEVKLDSQITPRPSPFASPRATMFSTPKLTLASTTFFKYHSPKTTTMAASLVNEDRKKVLDEMKHFSDTVQDLPTRKALEAIQFGNFYANNIKNFHTRSQQHPVEGSPDTVCDKMAAFLSRSMISKVFQFNAKDQTKSMEEMLKAVGSFGSGNKQANHSSNGSGSVDKEEEVVISVGNKSVKRKLDLDLEEGLGKIKKPFHMALRKSN